MTASKSEAQLRAEKALGVKLSAVKSMQQAEDEYFDRLWLEAEQLAKEQLAPKPEYDTVARPRHYMLFSPDDLACMASGQGIEVRDVIEKLVDKLPLAEPPLLGHRKMFISDYVQMIQYVMRFMNKNGVEDLKKARWYLDKMIEAYDSNS
jgi:hypothetical protein